MRWRTENPGEKDSTIVFVVDQVNERVIGVENGGLGGSTGAEGEDRGGCGRGGAFLGDLDAGAMNGIAKVQAWFAVGDEAAQIGHSGCQQFSGAQGVQQLTELQLPF